MTLTGYLVMNLQDRDLLFLGLVFQRKEQRGLGNLQPDDQANGDQDDTDEEGHAPAPAEELVIGQDGYGGDRERCQYRTGRTTHVGETRRESTAFPRRMFQRHEHGAAPLTANGQALDDAQRDQGDRGEHAHLRCRGQDPDQCGGDAHHEHRGNQDALAAQSVAEVAEYYAADRPGQVSNGQGGERGEEGDSRIEVGEEDLVEHQ